MKATTNKKSHDQTDVFPVKLRVVQLPDDVLHLVLRVELHQTDPLSVDLHIPRLGVLAEQTVEVGNVTQNVSQNGSQRCKRRTKNTTIETRSQNRHDQRWPRRTPAGWWTKSGRRVVMR